MRIFSYFCGCDGVHFKIDRGVESFCPNFMCSNYSAKVLKTMIDGEVMRGCEKFIIGRNLRIKVVSCYGS